jgi:hypothetical protein
VVESVTKTPAPKPSSSRMSVEQWSPIEGVPEMHTRPRPMRRPAAATPAAPLSSLFTPMEGVPETARGFMRPQTSSRPGLLARVVFTPVEGVPEKEFSFQKTPFDRQLLRAANQVRVRSMSCSCLLCSRLLCVDGPVACHLQKPRAA